MSYGFNPDLGVWSPYHMAYYSIIEAVTKLAAVGGDYRKARLTLQEYFEKLGNVPERWGKPFAALLGAYQAQIDLGIPAIGGKDSMSGSFGDIDVPPTLVAFAVGVEKAKNIISAELKEAGSQLVFLMAERNEDYTLKVEGYKNNLEKLHELILEGKVISASSVKFGGVSDVLSKMAFGNKIGVKFSNLTKEELFGLNYGSLVLEVKSNVNIDEEFKNQENFTEGIYASLDGKIYFLDLQSGKLSRDTINVGNPIKGSLSIDSREIPMLYVGEGINESGSFGSCISYGSGSTCRLRKQ